MNVVDASAVFDVQLSTRGQLARLIESDRSPVLRECRHRSDRPVPASREFFFVASGREVRRACCGGRKPLE